MMFRTYIDDLESNVEDTAECLADFKEDTTNTLTNLETTVDAIEHPCGGSDGSRYQRL